MHTECRHQVSGAGEAGALTDSRRVFKFPRYVLYLFSWLCTYGIKVLITRAFISL